MKTLGSIRRRPWSSIVLIGVLVILLPLLAFLQYRWIGQVSESERERMGENLDIAMNRFVEELFREFSDISATFQPSLETKEPLWKQKLRETWSIGTPDRDTQNWSRLSTSRPRRRKASPVYGFLTLLQIP